MGESQPYLGSVFTTALNLGSQFATQKLGLTNTSQTQALNQFQNQAAAQQVAASEGGFAFGLDNTTILMIIAAVGLILILK